MADPAQGYDVAVIGAGPAGLAAALAAADAGCEVVLLDAGARPGGQYFRHPPGSLPGTPARDWPAFAARRDRMLGHPRISYRPEHRVWLAGPGFVLRVNVGERDRVQATVRARRLVVASGAHDRPLPFPGWDLPGVFTAGGAQALLKGNAVLAGKRVVVGGTGPFLLPVATGLAGAGAKVAGVFEANRLGPAHLAMARHVARLLEGAGYGTALVRHRIPYRTGAAVVAAHPDGTGLAVGAVTVARLDRGWNVVAGSERRIACDAVAVGHGFVPQLDPLLQLGCGTAADLDGNMVAVVSAAQETTVPGVYAAGETTGIGGAQLARVEGELAGHAVARSLGRATAPPAGLAGRRASLRSFARALHRAHPVRDGWKHWLHDDTLVCRCEEVPAARVLEAARDLGATDPRTVKLLTRAGMGWCQGRMCGYATACLSAGSSHPGEAALRGLATRPFAQPVRLGDLAEIVAEETPHE